MAAKKKGNGHGTAATQMVMLLQQLVEAAHTTNKQLLSMDERFEAMDKRFESIDQRLEGMQAEIAGLRTETREELFELRGEIRMTNKRLTEVCHEIADTNTRLTDINERREAKYREHEERLAKVEARIDQLAARAG